MRQGRVNLSSSAINFFFVCPVALHFSVVSRALPSARLALKVRSSAASEPVVSEMTTLDGSDHAQVRKRPSRSAREVGVMPTLGLKLSDIPSRPNDV